MFFSPQQRLKETPTFNSETNNTKKCHCVYKEMRQAWRLASAANVYDFGHVALFVTRKKVNACGHIPVCDLTMAYSVNHKR